MNICILEGRITKDPVFRVMPSGGGKCDVTMAVEGAYNTTTKKNDATFINVVIWDRGNFKQATWTADRMLKGMKMCVQGQIISRSYDKDGVKKYVTEVVADKVALPDGQKDKDATRPDGGMFGGEVVQFAKEDLPF